MDVELVKILPSRKLTHINWLYFFSLIPPRALAVHESTNLGRTDGAFTSCHY